MDYVGIGKRIRAQRYKLDLSQEELAEMAGISLVHMSHIETANTKLSLPVLVDLACALGVRTDDLIFDKDTLGKDELLEEITLELDGDVIKSVEFIGGCDGNLQGISKLVTGMKAEDAIKRLEGIQCGFKPTSCPDQLAKALRQALAQ